MSLSLLLQQNEAICKLASASKKSLFQSLSHKVNERYPALSVDTIFDGLRHRDRLGSTSIGHGVAVPHCRLADCPYLIAQLATLSEPIEYDAIDGRPVDIVLLLLAPQTHHQGHLDALSQIAHYFNDAAVRMKLRRATNDAELTQVALSLSQKISQSQTHSHEIIHTLG